MKRSVSTWLSISLLCATVLCVWLARRPVAPLAPVAPLELTSADLKLETGRLLRRDDNSPFSGYLVEYYENGQPKSRSPISDGLMHGLSEGWHTNGNLQISEPFVRGVSDGVRIKWDVNGNKRSEATIVNGQLHGPFRRWHENGQLAEEMTMKSGVPDGAAVSYYPSGYLQAEALMQSGSVVTQTHWQEKEGRTKPHPANANPPQPSPGV